MIDINNKAPVKCRKSIIINANTVDVWKVLADINNWSSWQTDIKMARLNGPLQVGTTFDWKSGGLKIHSTIHTADQYSAIGWSGKSLGLVAIHNWQVTELNKQAQVNVEESMEGLLARIFKGMLNKNLERGMVRWLEMLKKKCEIQEH